MSQGDLFYKFFLSDVCLGKACYEKCKFKYDQSSADIRIGDLWGKMYESNEDGVSAVIAFTDKGNEVLRNANCELVEHDFNIVAEGQLKVKAKKTILYPIVRFALRSNQPLNGIIFKHISLFNRIINKLLSIIS